MMDKALLRFINTISSKITVWIFAKLIKLWFILGQRLMLQTLECRSGARFSKNLKSNLR